MDFSLITQIARPLLLAFAILGGILIMRGLFVLTDGPTSSYLRRLSWLVPLILVYVAVLGWQNNRGARQPAEVLHKVRLLESLKGVNIPSPPQVPGTSFDAAHADRLKQEAFVELMRAVQGVDEVSEQVELVGPPWPIVLDAPTAPASPGVIVYGESGDIVAIHEHPDDQRIRTLVERHPVLRSTRGILARSLSAVAVGALLFIGCVFLDANTRGQFTWPLRLLCVAAFAGVCLVAVTLG